MYLIVYGVMETMAGWLATIGEAGHAAAVGYAFKNSMLLGLPLPNHVLFLVFLSQQHGRVPGAWVVACCPSRCTCATTGAVPALMAVPLNVLVLVFGDVPSVKVLAGTAIAMGVLQVGVSRQQRKAGRNIM